MGGELGEISVEVTVAGLEQSLTFVVKALPTPDFDGDGVVGFGDFVQFAPLFGIGQDEAGFDPRYDLDEDGRIGFGDFVIFAKAFGKEATSI